MHKINRFAALSLMLAMAACGGNDANADLSFLDDLELAASTAVPQGTLSAVEMGTDSAAGFAPEVPEPTPPTAPARSANTRSSGGGSSGTYSTPAPPRARVETVKHTKRDAAIGAGAGAVIGAIAGGPRRRVEGAVVGAVVGGVIGGVIGNNVDKSTRVVYDFH
jgi:hypothetical protein